MTSKVIPPLSPGVAGLRLHLNQPESRLSKNINITHHSPPPNEELRNQLKTLDSGETKEKEERTRFSKTSSSHKSKSLSCYGGLDSFSVVKSLTKACMSQNCFTSVS